MSVIAKGVKVERVEAHQFITCDGCGAEVPDKREAMKGWVQCMRMVPTGAMVQALEHPLKEGETEKFRFDDVQHCCPKCWTIIETAMRAIAPASPESPLKKIADDIRNGTFVGVPP